MDFPTFRDLVHQIEVGKQLPDAVYVHVSAFSTLPDELHSVVIKIARALKIPDDIWNVIKFNKRDFKVTLLNYPGFECDSYPSLHQSYTIDLERLTVRKADYSKSDNPPILHRKEAFVAETHSLIKVFEEITREGESVGLYENARNIGFKQNWERLIKKKGYALNSDGRLVRLSEKRYSLESSECGGKIDRHLTAIDRNQLSQPMQILARHNYLDGEYSILDYGCGKGDDLRELEAHGIDCSGWDPVHNPEGQLISSAVVNLGFVLNVIEDRDERDETLRRAYEYAEKILIVSVMIAGDSVTSQFRQYKDGVVTSRNTFQKYYSQGEFKLYVETTLEENAIPVGQGILLVFKDKIEEHLFLAERQYVRRSWKQKTQREIELRKTRVQKDVIEKNIELFADYWEASLELGRIPASDEFEFSRQIRIIAGSHSKAHQALIEYFGAKLFNEARQKRKEDLLVYFALGLFEKRRPQSKMPISLKRDIKAFFGSSVAAVDEARELLFSVGNTDVVEAACLEAYQRFNCGHLEDGHSYTFHKGLLGEAPVLLRIYIGCATQLYGDLDDIQLIKAHFTSGKVSLMGYKEWSAHTPKLVERIKIRLRDQEVDYFDYVGKYSPPPLNNKSDFINEKLFKSIGIAE
ncbi:DNA phosphorothioation-associated putative methyltransferase [Microbulbifer sp. YPW16]|uniref:DNA phosphorothioation-associated putative methyltransferase n=1 Tax=Microbulbifer sp. YPW16 TaxID=2904242 RepID=UPI001E3652CA|nr:DNA phosphorothioation-associated putative methyltransferase [Microbulbifer sp. YPW16]UHQ53729.1 DNA phosphorothioation-associated putative methyltransferase [Microbulbifer sp. YPW16]